MESGRRNAESGLLARQLFPAAQGRYRLMNDRRRAQFATEAADLHRYGVPVDLAIALLDRVFQVGARHGRDVMRRKAQMRQATTAARIDRPEYGGGLTMTKKQGVAREKFKVNDRRTE